MQASGVAVRVHVEKAVRAEEEQVRMESVGHKSGRLERTSGWKGSSILQDAAGCAKALQNPKEGCRENAEELGDAGSEGGQGSLVEPVRRSPLRRAVEVYVEIGQSGGRMKISRLRYQG